MFITLHEHPSRREMLVNIALITYALPMTGRSVLYFSSHLAERGGISVVESLEHIREALSVAALIEPRAAAKRSA